MAEKAISFFAFAFVELAVLFIGISFLVALLQHYLSPDRVKSMLSARHGRGYLVGAGLGALTPFCSCSTIPIAVGMLKARAGFGPTIAFLFASPLVNPVVVTLFVVTFGWQLTAVYSAMALGLAVLAGFVLDHFGFRRFIRNDALDSGYVGGDRQTITPELKITTLQPNMMAAMPATAEAGAAPCCASVPHAAVKKTNQWRRMLKEAIHQFRSFLPYVAIGVAIGALCHGFVPDELVYRFAGPDNPLAVPVAAVIGVPLYVRASTMVPIGISLMAKGMSLGAVMALIIGGAGASIPEMVMLKRLFKYPVLIAFLVTVFGMAISAGLLMNYLNG
jgi:uncharacterized membrane protein YraQ (UPF0718 family)